MNRKILGIIHPIAGGTALLITLTFWISTVASKLSHKPELILIVKTIILYGIFILIPIMIAIGVSGFKLAGKSKLAIIIIKKKRMPIIALNGIFILIPCAVFLYLMAKAGNFTQTYAMVQGIELLAGAINIILLSLSVRDGFKLTKRFKL